MPLAERADAARLVQTLLRSPLVPHAVDLLWGEEAVLALLFEGSERAAAEQLESAQTPRRPGGRRRLAGVGRPADRRRDARVVSSRAGSRPRSEVSEALVRIGPTCFAYVPGAYEQAWSPWRSASAQFDPVGLLA